MFNSLTLFEKTLLNIKDAIYGTNKNLVRLLVIGNNTVDDADIGLYADIRQLTVKRSKTYDRALLLLKKNRYDLVLIDFDIENIEAIKQIRKFDSNSYRIPLIAVSTEREQDTMVSVLSYGFDDYLTKPVDHKNLELVLNRWLTNAVMLDNKISDTYLLESQKFKKIQQPQYSTTAKLEKEINYKDNSVNINTPYNVKNTLDIEASLKHSHYNNELARDLLILLIISIKSEKNKIISCYNKKNWVKIGELAHKLYGISCYCGVTILQEKTKAIEMAANEGNIPAIKTIYPQLIQAMDDLLLWNETHDIDVIFNLE
jgi:two-component system sensor histidine kinase BarA